MNSHDHNKNGYLSVNGKPFCTTDYPPRLTNAEGERVDISCSCNEEEAAKMIDALTYVYPDCSSKQVHTAEWFPVHCPGNSTIEKVVREYVDLAVLIEALALTQEFDYNLSFEEDDITKQGTIVLSWNRYTMNPQGFYIGYEKYQATLKLVEKTSQEKNHKQVHELDCGYDVLYSDYLVDLGSFEARLVDHPEEETCECDNTEIECNCELYTAPDEDFAYSEMNYKLFVIVLDIPIHWQFNSETHKWSIVNGITGDVLYESKGVRYY
jgi:hypothetical protein